MNLKISDKKWYVYTLNDPDTNIPFYVGKGQRYRMYNHFYNVKKRKIPNGNFRLYDKIKSIIDNGKKIEYEIVFSSDDEKETYNKEYQLIHEIGIDNLCNLFLGHGTSYSGEKHWNFGNTTPQNIREKIGKSKLGDKHTEEAKKKMSHRMQGKLHPMFGKHHTDKSKRKMSENHADFNGKKNPFYQKTHSIETKEYFKKLYSKTFKIILPDNTYVLIKGKKEVKKYIDNYNILNNTKISTFSLFQYGKNRDGWKIIKID